MKRYLAFGLLVVVAAAASYHVGSRRAASPGPSAELDHSTPRITRAASDDFIRPSAARAAPAETAPADGSAAAIAELAATAPAEALDEALRRADSALAEQLLERVAAEWARVDPYAALEHVGAIENPEQRVRLQMAVLREWAWNDAPAALAYLESLDARAFRDLIGDQEAMREIVRIDPKRMTDIATRFGEDVRSRVVWAASDVLARRSPDAALRYADTLRPNERMRALMAAAPRYGRADPDAALAWARAENPDLVRGVLEGIASANPEHAFALASTLPTRSERAAAAAAAANWAARRGDAAALADRLAAFPDEVVRGAGLAALLAMWGTEAPHEAAEWLLAQPALNIQGAFEQLGRQLGREAPGSAAAFLARLPREARAEWIAAAATGYAQIDARGALAWLEQFRAEPGYARGANGVAANLAETDPESAAQLLATVDDTETANMRTVVTVASNWAAKEPEAAVEWAIGLSDPLRPQAIASALQRWARDDERSAQEWALAQPAGGLRDAAASALLSVSDSAETDRTMLNALSSREAQEQAVLRAALQIAQRGRANAARELVAAYVRNPEQRLRIETTIDRMATMRIRMY